MSGTLYLVATPIGNLEDITLRALRILREVDLIAAEDTRQSRKLLNHYDIHKPLISYHRHNLTERGQELLSMLAEGKSIAVVSDAGTPAISDPGADIAALAIADGIEVVAIPGASALLTALSAGGIEADRFAFEGFLPRDKSKRRKMLQSLVAEQRTLVFYEAPHRIIALLEDMMNIFGGERKTAICRELTKLHEQYFRGTLQEAYDYFLQTEIRGEFTVIVAAAEKISQTQQKPDTELLLAELTQLLTAGNTRKAAAKMLAGKYQLPVKTIYELGIKP